MNQGLNDSEIEAFKSFEALIRETIEKMDTSHQFCLLGIGLGALKNAHNIMGDVIFVSWIRSQKQCVLGGGCEEYIQEVEAKLKVC